MRKRFFATLMVLAALMPALMPEAAAKAMRAENVGRVIFEASFASGKCGFTEEPNDAGAWKHENDGFMVADALGITDAMAAFALVSPEIVLDEVGNALSFDEMGSYFSNRWAEEAQIAVRIAGSADEWEALERKCIVGDQYSPKNTGDIRIPARFNGKKVQVAFVYRSDGHKHSGIWRVRNLVVKSAPAGKSDAGISFGIDKTEYVFGTDVPFEAPVLDNPNNLEVTYASSNDAVAAVNAATGSVNIVGEGKTVISASTAETDMFYAGTASYVISVVSEEDSKYADAATFSPQVAIEFTGQRCRYCPNQARGLQEMQNKYGKDNFVIAALHNLKDFSLLPASQVSLYNAEAELYAKSLEIKEGLPHLAYGSLGPWRNDLTVEEIYKTDDLLECTGKAEVNDDGDYVINIATRLRRNMKTALDGKNTDIILWTLENGIVAFQDDNGTPTYPEHNHIFRGSINSTWGEPYTVGTVYSNVLKVPETVSNIEKTEILALIVDHDSRIILDAGCFGVVMNTTGIVNVKGDAGDDAIYNMMGMRIKNPVRGEMYIKNGRKYIAR